MQKGLSQTELAKEISVYASHIGRYERGESKPLAKHLKALAQALGVSTDYILNGTDEDAAFAMMEDREMLWLFHEAQNFNDDQKYVVKSLLKAFVRDSRIKKEYDLAGQNGR